MSAVIGAVTGPNQRAWVRGDSAFATAKNIHAAIKAGAWFGFTIPAWPTVTKAISQIPDSALTGIQYPNQVRDEETGEWTSEPEVAETEFTAFVSKKADQQANCQLVVRRAKRLGERRPGEGELCTAYRRYAFITNTTLSAVGADAFHRGHAIIEQVIAEHTAEPPAHLPSGKLSANAAWLTFAVMAISISRAIAAAAGERHPPHALGMLRQIIATPALRAIAGKRVIVRLPARCSGVNAPSSANYRCDLLAPATSCSSARLDSDSIRLLILNQAKESDNVH